MQPWSQGFVIEGNVLTSFPKSLHQHVGSLDVEPFREPFGALITQMLARVYLSSDPTAGSGQNHSSCL